MNTYQKTIEISERTVREIPRCVLEQKLLAALNLTAGLAALCNDEWRVPGFQKTLHELGTFTEDSTREEVAAIQTAEESGWTDITYTRLPERFFNWCWAGRPPVVNAEQLAKFHEAGTAPTTGNPNPLRPLPICL
jgi:hypothetical protein